MRPATKDSDKKPVCKRTQKQSQVCEKKLASTKDTRRLDIVLAKFSGGYS